MIFKEENKFLPQAIKESQCVWGTWRKVYTYNKEVETTYCFLGLVKWRGLVCCC